MDGRVLRAVCWLYKMMLHAYPSTFQREYSREMMLAFRNNAQDVLQSTGSRALLPFMLHIIGDWLHTTLLERANMTTRTHALRWFAALPLAILAADGVWKTVGFFVRTDFHHIW